MLEVQVGEVDVVVASASTRDSAAWSGGGRAEMPRR
jgi:hypothetical protein